MATEHWEDVFLTKPDTDEESEQYVESTSFTQLTTQYGNFDSSWTSKIADWS